MTFSTKWSTAEKFLRLITKSAPDSVCASVKASKINTSTRIMPLRRGALVVLEGCDRSGKSTQSKLLVNSLKNLQFKTELLRFPDRTTKIGSVLNSYLQKDENVDDHAIHLLFTANRWETKEKILALLNNGTTVVVDRYCYSGIAYSASKKGMDIDWCKLPETGLPSPDLVVYLELNAEIAAERRGFGNERYEDQETQEVVHKNYLSLKDKNWQIVDANTTIEQLQQKLVELCINKIKEVGEMPIKYLWD